jgi:hypothetical protein
MMIINSNTRPLLCAAAVFLAAAAAQAQTSPVFYTGQGLNGNTDGPNSYFLNREVCGVSNGADAEGPYLLWVYTATNLTNGTPPTLNTPLGSFPMTKSANGTWKKVTGWMAPSTLLPQVVSVTGTAKVKNAQLTISHGCRPFTTQQAWCSPGFWRNALDGAWQKTGVARTAVFNEVVVPAFYQTANANLTLTLWTVLTTVGANTFGGADAPFNLNAYNATAAALTDLLPNYDFSLEAMNSPTESCPIDHKGNWKVVQPAS